MAREEPNCNRDAWADALATVQHYADDIASQAREGEVSDDLHNDYPGGDSYHHESHVDREYSLSEAAAVLDSLRDDEETDAGLWDGQEPRQAVCSQAAYTYGNAVLSRWQSLIESINECLDRWPLPSEDNREAIARGWIMLRGLAESIPAEEAGRAIARQASREWDGGRAAYAAVRRMRGCWLTGWQTTASRARPIACERW